MRRLEEIHNMIVVSPDEIKEFLEELGWQRIIEAVADTFEEEANGNVISPPKSIMTFEECFNDYRMMPSYMGKYPDYCGTKIISACSKNPEKYGLPLAMGTYLMNNRWTQESLIMFDACITTAYRTAAASAVGVRELSNMNSKVLGLIGCGQQAEYHIPAICAIRPIEKILVFDTLRTKMDKLIEMFPDLNVQRASKWDIFQKSDVIVTMTPTKQAHLNLDIIPDRQVMICAIGGDSEVKIEFYPEVLNVVDHFCDSLDQVSHTGTVHQAFEKGIITRDDLKSLCNFMIGKSEMDNSKKVKMFLSTGVALEDLAMAILIYEHVKDQI
jgi:alanine dehydrogenase